MRLDLPSGTVTFLFTDVEGSTRLLHELGAEGYAEELAKHRRVIREACARHEGVEVDTQGDAFFFAFPTAPGALSAAGEMTEALASGPIQVRIGLHTGTPLLAEEGYVGEDVHLAARIASSAHGGQVILSATTAELVDASNRLLQARLLELGEHRLKDVTEAVAIYQLGDGRFPPLKTISNTNLPRPASSFVGREAELAEVLARIEAGARLLTLTGPGGSGKTRLAIEAATTLVPEYKAGVFWVGLAALRDPALVSETIAQTLGAKDGLAEHIHERELLLLLDNLEQVIDAAPELSALLSACPNLTLLVTSRELLRVQGEVEYAVPPLAEPEAIALFCARSQLEPTDEIAELCVRLDSLPLAVSSPPRARRRSRSPRSSSASPHGSICSEAAATPIPASRRCGRRSSGRTTCSRPRSSGCSPASPSSPAGAPWRPRRRWRTPTSTPSSRSSRRVCCASRTAATGCSRRSGNTRASGSTSRANQSN